VVKRSILIGAVILVFSIGLAIILSATQEYAFNGVVYENPQAAPPIKLIESNNQRFEFKNHTNKIVLIFFGYTSCPDVCPSTLSDMKRLLSILGEDSEFVQVVFITVDPDRDSVDKLNGYMSLFHPKFIGLTGSDEELEKVWGDYGVFREVDTSSDTAAGYLVNHSSRIYLIDQSGRLLITYGFGTSPDSMAKDISYILSLE
jgi:protein SCO1/2